MPIPQPKPGQDEDSYMNTCMSFLKDEGKGDHKQRVAICLNTWRRKGEEKIMDLLTKIDMFTEEEGMECPEGQHY